VSEERALDKILVRDLLVRGIVGLNEWERKKRQDILVNLEIFADIRAAGLSDRVAETVNYRTITKAVIKTVEESSYFLVEALASEIARLIVEDFGVDRVRVRVEKPGAVRFARSVGVDIERSRGDFS
jgi:FolB domain-containing protein